MARQRQKQVDPTAMVVGIVIVLALIGMVVGCRALFSAMDDSLDRQAAECGEKAADLAAERGEFYSLEDIEQGKADDLIREACYER